MKREHVRRIDDLGRIVIPMEFINLFGISPKNSVKMEMKMDRIDEKIVITEYDPANRECERYEGIVRKLDDLNRLVPPMEWRKRYGFSPGTEIKITAEEGKRVIVEKL